MKLCSKCQQTLPLSAFSLQQGRPHGRRSHCKTCIAKAERVRYLQPKSEALEKACTKCGALKPHYEFAFDITKFDGRKTYCLACHVAAQRGRGHGLRHAQKVSESLRRKAHVVVGNAIRAGKLTRQPCESCGAHGVNENGRSIVHAHHDDYAKPLDVRWLCTQCHARVHADPRRWPGPDVPAREAA